MYRFRKIVISGLLVVSQATVLPLAAHAAGRAPVTRSVSAEDSLGTAESYLAELDSALALSAEQRRQLQPIIESELAEIRSIRAKSKSESEAASKIREVRLSALMQIMAILTDEQWEKFVNLEP